MHDSATVELDFLPAPAVRYGWGAPVHERIARILSGNAEEQTAFLGKMRALMPLFRRIPVAEADATEGQPFWDQPWFPPLDGMGLSTLLVSAAPTRYVEIGSGNSTRFARHAIEHAELPTLITSIDPAPRASVDRICDTLVRSPLEDIDLTIFDELTDGDVLFMDGSHRSFQNSDVTVFFLEVLPRLRDGVIVGMHDIFWPCDYPPAWKGRYYNEQYLLGVHMLALGARFEPLFSCMGCDDDLRSEIGRASTAFLGNVAFGGGSLWWRHHVVSMPDDS